MKYVLYARKSTEEDDRQVLSIEAQLVELQEYAAKEKLEIVASFQEAKTAKEPGEKHRLEPYFNFGGRKFFNPKQKPRKSPKIWAFSIWLDFQAHICYIGHSYGIVSPYPCREGIAVI